ncbi:MAG: hypothetical protein RL375_1447 [Pseudomonadota bacterium]|jgi:hypothetical protein
MTSLSTLTPFIDQAWVDHADQADAVAARFPSWVDELLAAPALPDEVPALARLIAHVCGEHLALWQAGVDLILRLDDRAAALGDGRHRSVLARHVAALRLGAGDDQAAAALPVPEQVAALAQASVALAGQTAWPRAIALYRQALALAGSCWGSARGAGDDGAAGVRALAVGGNNLASALEERGDLDLHHTQAMLEAAHAALEYWRVAGGWLEEERALYTLARCCLRAGYDAAAVAAAQACVDICQARQAPAFEHFFGQAVLALGQRAAGHTAAFEQARDAALAAYATLAADEQPWCRRELGELGATATP